MKKFKNLSQLRDTFTDEATCREYLAQHRWKDGNPVCPYCKHDKSIWKIEDGKRYKCSSCKKKFSVTVGTIFEDTNIPLSKWFYALFVATSHKKGISSCQLARDLSITQKSAWHVLHRIREMAREKNPSILKGTIEADETFVGGKNGNRHKNKKHEGSQGRSSDKTPVFGMLEKGGDVKAGVVPDTKAETLKPIIKDWVQKGSIVVTDEWYAYNGLEGEYNHQVVKHHTHEYVKEGLTTNGLEGFWSLFKRGIFGIYHYASPKHLNSYCDEFSFRFNTRKMNETERFDIALTRCEGTLPYKQLIAG